MLGSNRPDPSNPAWPGVGYAAILGPVVCLGLLGLVVLVGRWLGY